jgi:hypothetical protein
MAQCARKLHSLATARASHVLAVLSHSIISPIHKATDLLRGTELSRTRYCMQNLAD